MLRTRSAAFGCPAFARSTGTLNDPSVTYGTGSGRMGNPNTGAMRK